MKGYFAKFENVSKEYPVCIVIGLIILILLISGICFGKVIFGVISIIILAIISFIFVCNKHWI